MLEIVHQSVLAKSWFSLTMLDLSLWSRCFTGRNLWKLECMFKQKIHIKCQLPIWRLQFQFPTFSFRWREWTGNNPHNKEHHQLNPGCNSRSTECWILDMLNFHRVTSRTVSQVECMQRKIQTQWPTTSLLFVIVHVDFGKSSSQDVVEWCFVHSEDVDWTSFSSLL